MTTNDRTKDQQEPEDLDVRKATARLRTAGTAQSRRSIVAVAQLLGGVANATADAFQELNEAMTTELVTKYGLGASVYMGVREGNVRFLEELSRTSRRVFDALRPPNADEPQPAAVSNGGQPVDYERLAKLVAAEMRDPEATTS
jgi:hypothetical protein